MNSLTRCRVLVIVLSACLIVIAFSLFQAAHRATVHAQASLGGPVPNLTPLETLLFNQGSQDFIHIWTPAQGLGPVFIQASCSTCHASPATGGNSANKTTLFISTKGNEGEIYLQPKSIGRFKTCTFSPEHLPRDVTIAASHQAYQTFGSGLIDAVSDADITAQAIDKGMGVHGMVNLVLDENGNLRPGRFGSKSEFPDLLTAVASEMVHEVGITNPVFPQDDAPQGKLIPPECVQLAPGQALIELYHFLTYLAPSMPGGGNSNGQALFTSIGCALCHVPAYTTVPTVTIRVTYRGNTIVSKALSNQQVNLYSDLLLHDMGGSDADGFPLGEATGSQFRTAPLWGLSTRLADGDGLLHDGLAKDIPSAIARHGGEASQVITNFNALSASDQADLIAFISSL